MAHVVALEVHAFSDSDQGPELGAPGCLEDQPGCVSVCVRVCVHACVCVYLCMFEGLDMCVEAAERERGSKNESEIDISKVMDILDKSTLFGNKYTLMSIHCRHMCCAHLKDALGPR